MNDNFMMLLLPLLLNKNGGNADMAQLLLKTLSAKSGSGTVGQSSVQNALFPMMMAMMMGKNASKPTAEGKENAPLDVGAIFGQDVWSVLRAFMSIKGGEKNG